jgi:hypothetical protein
MWQESEMVQVSLGQVWGLSFTVLGTSGTEPLA